MKTRSSHYALRITPLALALSMAFASQALAENVTDEGVGNVSGNTVNTGFGGSLFGSDSSTTIAPVNGSTDPANLSPSGNTVTLGNLVGNTAHDIVGGGVQAGAGAEASTGNTVTISTTTNTINNVGVIVGGVVTGSGTHAVSGNTVNLTASGGSITITPGGSAGSAISGGIFQGTGTGTGTVSSNHVNITGNGGVITVNNNVFGGFSSKGDVNANTVTVTGDVTIDQVDGGVIGGFAEGGKASNNEVEINTTSTVTNAFGGITTGDNDADHNKVTITSGTVGNVYGGHVRDNGNATDNIVIVNGGTVSNVVGGVVDDVGNANNNKVTIGVDAIVTGETQGARASLDGNANNNTVTVNGEARNNIYGAIANGSGSANANQVTIGAGATVSGNIKGGSALSNGNATSNTVTVNGDVTGYVYGGHVNVSGDANSNQITIGAGATVDGHVQGGRTESGNADNNAVTVNGTATGTIYGGRVVTAGDVTNNSVTITGTASNNNQPGDFTAGGYTTQGNATGNSVQITGTNAGKVFGGVAEKQGYAAENNHVVITGGTVGAADTYIAGGEAGGVGAVAEGTRANNNSVTIDSGTINAYAVYGGVAQQKGDANANQVVISGGTFSNTSIFGSHTQQGNANNSTVNITGGTGISNVYGGHTNGDGNASQNTLNISGGTISGVISGGEVGGTGDAINNTVTISDSANITTATLLGGSAVAGNTFTGNTLTFKGWTGTVANVNKFEIINFYLPTTFAAGDTALTVTGTANVEDSTLNIGIDGGNKSALNRGDEFNLIQAGTLQYNTGTKVQGGVQGVSLDYKFDAFEFSNTSLKVKVTDVSLNPQTKALSEGFLGGVAFARQGADLVADQGIAQARASAQRASNTSLQGFAAFSYGDSKYKTGSHVDVDGYSLLAGLSGRQNGLTVGAFLEAGDGSYDSYNSFANRASVKGDGDTRYYGGGLLARFDFANSLYAEASVRAGRLKNEFSGNLADTRTKYDTKSLYTSLHAGLGYVLKLSEKSNLDVYGKYLWTQVGDDKVRLSTGDPVKFDSVNSQRLRAGARFTSALSNAASFYVGAAYEHEFDGKADATVYGHKIKSPDLKGGTGIGEIGFTLRPSGNQNFSVDIGLQGYGGKREGATGSVQVKYQF